MRATDGAPWIAVPSVTGILGVLDKPALPWWGMRVGVAGVLELLWSDGLRWEPGSFPSASTLTTPNFRKGKMSFQETPWDKPEDPDLRAQIPTEDGRDEVVDRVTNLLTAEKLTTNHVKEAAGDRGQTVHDAFELWLDCGLNAHVSSYPEHERGYLRGFQAFCHDVDVMGEAHSEMMVGSYENLFAGRYDCGVLEEFSGEFVVDRVTGKRERVEGKVMLDLKTSKRPYVTHFLQMRGYEGARVEEGHDAFDDRLVLLVDKDGRYELTNSERAFKKDFTYEDFLACRAIYDAVGGLL